MDTTVLISSSDDENNSKVAIKVYSHKKFSKTGKSRSSKLSKKNLIPNLSTVVLNDDGDDEEFQLDIHTKSRKQLEEQKSTIPHPLISSSKKIDDQPPQTIIHKSTESDVTFTNITDIIPKPLLPNLTITPVNKTNDSESMQYLKLKNIDALKNNTTDQIEVNSTLEINQSTNLYILNSDQSSSSILGEALQKLTQSKSDIIVTKTPASPLFQISNVHTLAKTVKRKQAVAKNPKLKRIKVSKNSEVISLIDDENAIDTISLDSDSEDDAKTENTKVISNDDQKEFKNDSTLPNDENSEDVVCIENEIENIDICSSSEGESEVVKDKTQQLKKVEKTIKELVNTENAEELRDSGKLGELQNTEKVDKLQNTENVDELQEIEKVDELQNTEKLKESYNTHNVEKLQNSYKLVESQHTEEILQLKSVQKELQLENTKEIDQVENSEKIVDPINEKEQQKQDFQNKPQVESTKNIDKTELQNIDKTVKRRIELESPEKTIESLISKTSPQIKIVLENILETIVLKEKENENNEINDNDILFEKFLETCSSETVPSKCRLVISESIGKIRKRYENANIDYLNSDYFSKLLNIKIKEILLMPVTATVVFSEILMELKNNKQETEDTTNDLDKETLMKIKKLESMLKILNKKIRQLEQTELSVEDDWDENSTYLQEERYKRKCCQIYKKICELQKRDQNAGRLTLMKINFEGSKYPKINQAINKLYNKKRQFPNLYDMTKCIKKCVKRHALKFTEDQIDIEAREMFKLLGNKLQKRRQKETYQNLMAYPDEVVCEDPASKDIELEKKLRASHLEANTKIVEIMNKFVQKQNSGEDVCLNEENSDSEKSEISVEDSEADSNDDEKTS